MTREHGPQEVVDRSQDRAQVGHMLPLRFHDDVAQFYKTREGLKERTILLTCSGSNAYGLATKDSDTDLLGIALPTVNEVTGLQASFEQISTKAPDATVYELRKMLGMCVKGNPAALDILFCDDASVDPSSYRFGYIGVELRSCRAWFLSQWMTRAFLGYAQQQRNRYLHTSDQKAAMHAVRVLRVLKEAHETGEVNVYRKHDRAELLGYRLDKHDPKFLVTLIDHEEAKAKEAEKKSALPPAPKQDLIEQWCMDVLASKVVHT